MIVGSAFFATYGGGHAAALAPVIARLDEAGIATCTMAFTTARAALRLHGIDAIGVADALPFVPSFAEAVGKGACLAQGQSRHPQVTQAETEAYLGVGYVALERQYGLEGARQIWARSGRQAFLPVSFFTELFARERPAVVVATNSPRSERAALEAARVLGIPSLCVVDLYAAYEIKWCGAPGYASTICVLNDEVRERFIAHGAAPARVVATGNPAFDRLGALDYGAVRKQVRGRLGLADADRLLLWVSQPEPALHPFSAAPGDMELPLRIEEYLAASFGGDARTHLVLRLHPSEFREPWVTGPRIRYSDRREPLDEQLCACDCVLTCSSTVGVEAALLGVPVVQAMDSVFSPDLPLQEMGMATAVATYREAGSVIANILEAPVRDIRSPRTSHYKFGAVERVAQEVLELIGGSAETVDFP